MPALPSYFDHYLKDIRPTQNQRDDCKTGHETLQKRLQNDESLKEIVVDTFLQGSYRRVTAVRPTGDAKSDVDVITVTNLDKTKYTAREAMNLFVPFLDKHYKGKWEAKGRAFGISLSYVELDLVITAAPSEAQTESWRYLAKLNESDIIGETKWEPADDWFPESLFDYSITKRASDWKLEPLDIPDREANEWDKTHPLAQIAATWAKSRGTNRHYVNVVKALKWWKVAQQSDIDYPKGYPLEHLLWVSCPDGITSIAQGVVLALEDIASRYRVHAVKGQVPFIPDHGVPEHNVLGRLSVEDFQEFYRRICVAARQARDAFDESNVCESAEKWRLLFGSKFPQCPENAKKGGYTPRKEASIVPGGRFA
jgi:hypothetical protein